MIQNDTRNAITQLVFLNHVDQLPEQIDLALVLGSPSISNILPAISLYHQGRVPNIWITGHGRALESSPEWKAYQDYAVASGVPQSAIHIEPDARNTLENFVFTAPLIDRVIGWPSLQTVAICCKPLHTRRAFMTAQRHFPRHLRLLMVPPKHMDDIQAEDWWLSPHGFERVMGELRRIGQYAQNGDLAIE